MIARYNLQTKEEAYRYYVTDALYCGLNGNALIKRFYDLINTPEETREADEIIMDVVNKAGLRIV